MKVKTAMNSRQVDTQTVRMVIFTRFPLAGRTKTRLIPALGPQGAADLQRKMTEFTLRQVRQTGCPVEVRFTDGTVAQIREWLGGDVSCRAQGEGDLGERLVRAFGEAFKAGARKVLVIGSDCPDNRSANMLQALRALETASCVIGPALDGGYYLLGLTAPRPELFDEIDWGTDAVLGQTLAKMDDYRLLPPLSDVDEAQDVPAKISVIIPALNEAASVRETVMAALEGFEAEVLVVDGGSHDRTQENARQAGARVLIGAYGRARQMNLGAKSATGELLLFLHADSLLSSGWDRHLRKILKDPATVLGHFRFALREGFAGASLITLGTNARCRLLQRPYGDQGLFLRKRDFEALGGFADVPILEDLLLVKQAAKKGRIRCADAPLATSDRRWRTYGALRTTFMNQAVLLAAWLGADLHKLDAAYRRGENPLRSLWS